MGSLWPRWTLRRISGKAEKRTLDTEQKQRSDLLEAVKFSLETLEIMWPSPHLNFGLLLEWWESPFCFSHIVYNTLFLHSKSKQGLFSKTLTAGRRKAAGAGELGQLHSGCRQSASRGLETELCRKTTEGFWACPQGTSSISARRENSRAKMAPPLWGDVSQSLEVSEWTHFLSSLQTEKSKAMLTRSDKETTFLRKWQLVCIIRHKGHRILRQVQRQCAVHNKDHGSWA